MHQSSHPLPTPPSLEEDVHEWLSQARKDVLHRYRECEDGVRRSPTTAVLVAVAAGYLLHRLPLRSILVTQARVLAALAPPALLAFGASKLSQHLHKRGLHEAR